MLRDTGKQQTGRWACGVLAGVLAILPLAARAGQPEFTIEAQDFTDGNVQGQAYIWNAGELPNWAEYEFPVTAECTLAVLYAAAQARPVEISLDGKMIHTGCQGVTGSWEPGSAKWEEQCRMQISAGRHRIRLQTKGPMPHICALRWNSSVPWPDGWSLKVPTAAERAQRILQRAAAARARQQMAMLDQVNPEAIRRAIDDLERTFPGRYDAARHRQTLAEYQAARAAILQSLTTGQPVDPPIIAQALADVRAALVANPLLDFDRLLVVRRSPAGPNQSSCCKFPANPRR